MKKIIIAGNVKAIVEKEKNILSRSYFNIFTATSTEEALEVHQKEKADLIVIDEDMKGMRGDEFCSAIRNDEGLKYVSIILLCPSSETDIRRCKNSGANLVMMKPYKPEELFDEVVNLINVPVRKDMRVITTLHIEGLADEVPFVARSENISISGILIKTDKTFKRGDIIACSFFIDHERVTLKGEIVRIVESLPDLNHYGIKFVDLHPLPERLIEKFVKKNK